MNKSDYIPEKNPFKVPDNYFEELNEKIISATSGKKQMVRKINGLNRLRKTLLIAATVTGFILISYIFIKLFNSGKVQSQVSEVYKEVYSESFIEDIDLSSLEEGASTIVPMEEVPDVSKKEIIDYLLKENIEINDIYEQI